MSELDKELDFLESQKRSQEQLVDMAKTQGWKILKTHFENLLKLLLEACATEEDPKKIVRFQEQYRAYKDMLKTVEASFSEYDLLDKQIDTLKAEINYQTKYALS